MPGELVLVRVLGTTQSAVVWEARQGDRHVAVKFLDPGASEERRERLFREARAMAVCAHPGILACYAVGEHEGRPYFVMELARGRNLAERLAGPCPPRQAVQISQWIARATAAIHRQGIVHRGIKLRHLYFAHDGKPKLGGFGATRAMDDATISNDRAIISENDAELVAEDLHGLGTVLHRLLVGPGLRPPLSETLLPADVPGELLHICQRCMGAPAPWAYRSAREAAEDLQRLL